MGLSSAINICIGYSWLKVPESFLCVYSCPLYDRRGGTPGPAKILKRKVVLFPPPPPPPFFPCIMCTSFPHTTRQRLEPPYLRVVEESTWVNALNRRPILSAGMPMPVSR